jgi:hypothetical protein
MPVPAGQSQLFVGTIPLGWTPVYNTKWLDYRYVPNPPGNTNGVFAYSGGAFDTFANRLIICGGGHGDYAGNEIYALNADTLTMTRLNAPTQPYASAGSVRVIGLNPENACPNFGDVPAYTSTAPNSRHTYSGVCYCEGINKLFIMGGAEYPDGQSAVPWDMWLFDFAGMSWTQVRCTYASPSYKPGWPASGAIQEPQGCIYHPHHNAIYLNDRNFHRLDLATGVVTRINTSEINAYHNQMIYDPNRNRAVLISDEACWYYDLKNAKTANYSSSPIPAVLAPTTGDPHLQYPGFCYDNAQDRYVLWRGGNTLYVINPDTWVFTQVSYSGGPACDANVTSGRFGYSPKSNIYLSANATDANCYVARISPKAVTPDDDWTNRSTGSGVVKAVKFNSIGTYASGAELVPRGVAYGAIPPDGTHGNISPRADNTWGISLDTSIKRSGYASMKQVTPAGTTGAGNGGGKYLPGGDTSIPSNFPFDGLGKTYSQGMTLYFQIAIRLGPNFWTALDTWKSDQKFFILHYSKYSNSSLECTMISGRQSFSHTYQVNPVLPYNAPFFYGDGDYVGGPGGGWGSRTYLDNEDTIMAQGSSYIQQGGYYANCAEEGYGSDPFFMLEEKWYTILVKIAMPALLESGLGSVEAWEAHDGLSYKKFVNVRHGLYWQHIENIVTDGFNNLTLAQYANARVAGYPYDITYWYDEFIVSDNWIPAPACKPYGE